jgi:hypothetical protein
MGVHPPPNWLDGSIFRGGGTPCPTSSCRSLEALFSGEGHTLPPIWLDGNMFRGGGTPSPIHGSMDIFLGEGYNLPHTSSKSSHEANIIDGVGGVGKTKGVKIRRPLLGSRRVDPQ